MKWHRKSAIVDALHLNSDAQPDEIIDFVSRANEDMDVAIRPSAVYLRRHGQEFKLPVGYWLVLDADGALTPVDNDSFIVQYEYVGG